MVQHHWGEEARNGGQRVDESGNEVGTRDVAAARYADAGQHQNDRNVKAEGSELGSLAGVGNPAEDGGPLLDRICPDHLQEICDLGLLDVEVSVRQHVQRVVEELHRGLLCLLEVAPVNQ